jgi:hypothetical protein
VSDVPAESEIGPFCAAAIASLREDGGAAGVATIAGMMMALHDGRYDDLDVLLGSAGELKTATAGVLVAFALAQQLAEVWQVDPRKVAELLARTALLQQR